MSKQDSRTEPHRIPLGIFRNPFFGIKHPDSIQTGVKTFSILDFFSTLTLMHMSSNTVLGTKLLDQLSNNYRAIVSTVDRIVFIIYQI